MKDYRSHLSPRQRKLMFDCFVKDVLASIEKNKEEKGAAQICKVQPRTANAWYRYFRDCIYKHQRQLVHLSGRIEVDHSQFKTRRRKRYRMVNGMPVLIPTRPVTVFGVLQRDEIGKQHKVFVQVVSRADARITIPIVQHVVDKGSTIYSDMWRAFNELGENYTHKRVNHKKHQFSRKEGEESIHTGTIDQFWKFCEDRLSRFNGLHSSTVHLHIYECAFRYNHKQDLRKVLKKVLI